MNVTKSAVTCDLSELALSNALAVLRCTPDEVTVFCSNVCSLTAEGLRKKHGCKIVFVPEEILSSQFSWAITCQHGTYWSEGA